MDNKNITPTVLNKSIIQSIYYDVAPTELDKSNFQTSFDDFSPTDQMKNDKKPQRGKIIIEK